jgi:sugar (pentulose or hexulose) kinase
MEAIALTMADRVAAMRDELGARLDEVVVSGGGSASALFMQVFADTFGIPASRPVGPAGASLGAAICAAVATGAHPDFDTAAARMEKPRERFLPQPETVSVYRRMNEAVYRRIRDATDPLLQQSWPIFH